MPAGALPGGSPLTITATVDVSIEINSGAGSRTDQPKLGGETEDDEEDDEICEDELDEDEEVG